jgi:hypothetical protein
VAFSVKIIGYAGAGKQIFDMEPPWWDQAELRQDPRMRKTVSDGYLDYDAELSTQEARDLHEHFRPRATRGAFADEAWQEIIQPMLRQLDAYLGRKPEHLSHCRIHVFEWESGL